MERLDKASVEALFKELKSCVESDNVNPAIVTPIILKLEEITDDRNRVPDDLLDRLLGFLATEPVLKSTVAALILPFFAFQASRLTKRQRRRCIDCFRVPSNRFEDGNAAREASRVYDKLLIAKG